MFGLFNKKGDNLLSKTQAGGDEQVNINELLAMISRMQKELDRLKVIVTSGKVGSAKNQTASIFEDALKEIKDGEILRNESERVVEGVFDGQNMIGADGQQYDVPANYASKSKLVEGDILKLTINNLGAFIYKQIKPIERIRKLGELEQDFQSLQYYAVVDGKKWKLLTASVTYFKGVPGDEVIFLIPAEGESRSAAVENIIQR